jgi:hypothetical protein
LCPVRDISLLLLNITLNLEYLSSIRNIARLVPALSSLSLDNNTAEEPEILFEVLSIFFENCQRIITLALESFDFGPEPFPFISDVIKAGMSRLFNLKIDQHYGSFGVIVSIPNLKSFEYHQYEAADSEISVDLLLSQIDQVTRCCSNRLSSFGRKILNSIQPEFYRRRRSLRG